MDRSRVCWWIHSRYLSSTIDQMPEDPPQQVQHQTRSHRLGYHCSYRRAHRSALPIVGPAEKVDGIQYRFSLTATHVLLTGTSLRVKHFQPLGAPGPAHPSPDGGHLQTLHSQKTGQISEYADGL